MLHQGYFSDAFQKWFGRHLNRIGTAAPRTSFHSTRHNFHDQLRQIGGPRDVALALGGWAGNGGIAEDCGGGLRPRTLHWWIAKVRYEGLELPNLPQ